MWTFFGKKGVDDQENAKKHSDNKIKNSAIFESLEVNSN